MRLQTKTTLFAGLLLTGILLCVFVMAYGYVSIETHVSRAESLQQSQTAIDRLYQLTVRQRHRIDRQFAQSWQQPYARLLAVLDDDLPEHRVDFLVVGLQREIEQLEPLFVALDQHDEASATRPAASDPEAETLLAQLSAIEQKLGGLIRDDRAAQLSEMRNLGAVLFVAVLLVAASGLAAGWSLKRFWPRATDAQSGTLHETAEDTDVVPTTLRAAPTGDSSDVVDVAGKDSAPTSARPDQVDSVLAQVRRRLVVAESEQAHLLDELRESNQELEHFAYVASHDLQEPLRTVSNYLNLIERRYTDQIDDTGKELMSFAVDGAQRMQQLVQALLDYSRVFTRGEEPGPTDLNDIVDTIRGELAQWIDATGTQISTDGLSTIIADKGQVLQLLRHLISNAIKFHDPSRQPRVIVSARQSPHSGGEWPATAGWYLSVSDNGIGIEDKYFSRIFDVFQRLHTRSEYPGTGMGLAICKKIVERHGGRIWIEPSAGEGSRFHCFLPRPRALDADNDGIQAEHQGRPEEH